MPKKTCEKCGKEFKCGMNEPGKCWCADLPMVMPIPPIPSQSKSTSDPIPQDCLCQDCLKAEIEKQKAQA